MLQVKHIVGLMASFEIDAADNRTHNTRIKITPEEATTLTYYKTLSNLK